MKAGGTDMELLEAWRQGNVQAGEALFDRYYEGIRRFFFNKILSEPETYDLVQQTFLAALEGRERIQNPERFRAYLFGIAHHKFIEHLKKKRATPINIDEQCLDEIADVSQPSADTRVAWGQQQRLLLKALRSIPISHQVLLEMRFWENMKTREIAEILNVAHPTLRHRLQRAQALLKTALERLARSPELLESTLTDLETWAARCRAELGSH